MKKSIKAATVKTWEYNDQRRKEKREHKKQRAQRKNRNNVWQSVGE